MSYIPSQFLKIYFCTCVFECTPRLWVPEEARRGHWSPWNWNYRWLWIARRGCSELNLSPLEEQKALLTTRPSAAPLSFSLALKHLVTIVVIQVKLAWVCTTGRVPKTLVVLVSRGGFWGLFPRSLASLAIPCRLASCVRCHLQLCTVGYLWRHMHSLVFQWWSGMTWRRRPSSR